jgi:hypothetical protein
MLFLLVSRAAWSPPADAGWCSAVIMRLKGLHPIAPKWRIRGVDVTSLSSEKRQSCQIVANGVNAAQATMPMSPKFM